MFGGSVSIGIGSQIYDYPRYYSIQYLKTYDYASQMYFSNTMYRLQVL